MTSLQAATTAKEPAAPKHPTFKEAPRYRLLEKAFLSGVKVRRGNDWIPLDDVLLDPEAQPMTNQLSGAFGGLGTVDRQPLEIEYRGIPGDHMEPLNDAARWALENVELLMKHAREQRAAAGKRGKRVNPIDALTVIGPDATVLRPLGDSV